MLVPCDCHVMCVLLSCVYHVMCVMLLCDCHPYTDRNLCVSLSGDADEAKTFRSSSASCENSGMSTIHLLYTCTCYTKSLV